MNERLTPEGTKASLLAQIQARMDTSVEQAMKRMDIERAQFTKYRLREIARSYALPRNDVDAAFGM